jgi:hypothetical protein
MSSSKKGYSNATPPGIGSSFKLTSFSTLPPAASLLLDKNTLFLSTPPLIPPTANFQTISVEVVSNMNNTYIHNVTDPILPQDVATKSYVDNQGGGTPGGSDTDIQYNNSGLFGGSNNFTWNNGTNTLTIIGDTNTDNLKILSLLQLANGSIGAPSLTFTSALNSGLFTNSLNTFGVVAGGTQIINFEANKMSITGTSATSLFANSIDSSSSALGSITTTGGISSSLVTDASNSNNGGSLTLAGGAAISKKLFVGDSIISPLIKLTSGANTISLQAPTLAASYILTFPVDDGNNGQILTTDGSGILFWSNASGGGTVTSVSGTINRIISTGGTTPIIDISANYVGQTSITTLGTIGAGIWNGSLISSSFGGTGVNNGTSTLTLGGNLTTGGAFASVFTMTAATAVTFPTSGTLATVSQIPSVTPSALTEINDTNVTLTLGGTPATALLQATSITAGWTGILSGTRGGTGVNNGTSTLTLGGNLTTGGAFASVFTMTAATAVTFPTSGTLATVSQIPSVTPSALTEIDDTNITLTLGGTPATALLQATSITAGWAGTLSGTRGGTGVNNGSNTITLGGNLTTSGAFTSTFTMTAATAVTFPTSGTLATTTQLPTPAALTNVNDTNITLTLGGTPATALLQATSITAGWAGTLSGTRGGTGVNNGTNTLTLGGNLTTSGAFASTFTMTALTAVTFPTSGTLAITTQLPIPAALTNVNDTNVTLTLGGTPSTALLQATSITAGWSGTLSGTRGGTGVNNGSNTLTLGGNLTTSGAFASTFTMTAATAVTFPTSGTLATTTQLPTPAALTNVNDTNITLTLGGTPATALLQATSITAGWTGILSGTRGGTGVNNGSNTITLGGNLTTSATTTIGSAATVNQLFYTSTANNITGLTTANNSVLTTDNSGVPSWNIFSNYAIAEFFGDGSDGSTTISVNTLLSKDMFYTDLTISSATLTTLGFRIFVNGTLTITTANSFISSKGSNGSNSIGTSGTGGGVSIPTNTIGGTVSAAGNGVNGVSGTGVAGIAGNASGSTSTFQLGGNTGNSGSGGSNSGAGGAAGSGTSSTVLTFNNRRFDPGMLRGVNILLGGASGPSGGTGSATSITTSGGSAGGGSGAGIVFISARIVNRNASASAGSVNVTGGNAGTNFQQIATSGGTGGSSGGGGGFIYFSYGSLTGTTATNFFDVSGGTGANGTNAAVSGNGGSGGSAGGSGQVYTLNLSTNTGTLSAFSSSPIAGSANSGATGGGGGTPSSSKVNL